MSTFSIFLTMFLGGCLGFMLWAVILAAIARIGKKRIGKNRIEQLARSGLPLEVDTATRW